MRIYNSLTQKTQLFAPLNKKQVTMYVCGITPYDTTHLGHAFTYVFFDVVYRYLAFKGYKVTYVQNVTDIDDDILKRAKKENRDWKELGDFWTSRFLADMKTLNVLPPTHYVKATSSIDKMIQIILSLIKKGYAYEKEGNVYFSIQKFNEYGKLSRFSQEEMSKFLKERGGDPYDPLKKHPLDFLLWQKSKDDEPFWESPWGKGPPASQARALRAGRPGWHIECSAMIHQFLGDQIDIHGGGYDLIYPHHESEIAESESFTDKSPFVKYWMHTAMLKYKGQKMAKSVGNLIMVSDLLKKYSPNAIRFLLLSHHYRKPWEFAEKELEEAEKNVRKLHDDNTESEFINALDDDFNIPLVLQQKKLSSKALSILGFVV